MKIFSTIIFILFSNYLMAQHVQYSYDLVGNRTNRIYSVPRLANPQLKDSIAGKNGISVFPNPVGRTVKITISKLNEGENAVINLCNIEGKLLVTKTQATKEESLDLSNLNSGIYYLRILLKEESVLFKLVKL